MPGSSNLMAQHKFLSYEKMIYDMKDKSVIFCFLELKAKEKASFSKKHRGQGDFSVENLGLFFQS